MSFNREGWLAHRDKHEPAYETHETGFERPWHLISRAIDIDGMAAVQGEAARVDECRDGFLSFCLNTTQRRHPGTKI